MWVKWVLLWVYLLWTYASMKDAVNVNRNKLAWYTMAWFAVTLPGIILICCIYL